jgi:hypothetical protein
MIISDMKMVVLAFMLHELEINLDCCRAMPILVVITRVFNAKCRWFFEEVRANCQYEFLCARTSNRYENRATFTREIIEADKFKEINDKHKRHGLKPFCTTPSSSLLLILFRH